MIPAIAALLIIIILLAARIVVLQARLEEALTDTEMWKSIAGKHARELGKRGPNGMSAHEYVGELLEEQEG